MPDIVCHPLLALLCACGVSAACAQTPAAASAVPGAYRSAFDGYRPFEAELPVQPWARSNEAVREAGGWRAYAREIEAGQAAGSAPGAASVSPSPPLPVPAAGAAAGNGTAPADPHAGHRPPARP